MNRGKISIVHVAKKQTGMTEEEYRDLLASVGAKSSKELTRKTFSVVMGHFEQLGFKSTSAYRARSNAEAKKHYLDKIDAILGDLGEDRKYADSIARNSFKVKYVHWLEEDKLRKVMQMLVYHQNRSRRKHG
ncbi:MAG: regulatory protein GemA [Desulfobacterales bacterium]|nr:regulatory protein GemA [Desulfobacterales bacterium]